MNTLAAALAALVLTAAPTPVRVPYVVSLDTADVARGDGLLPPVGVMMVCADGTGYELVTVMGTNGYVLTLDAVLQPGAVCAFGVSGSDRVRHLTVHARVGGVR